MKTGNELSLTYVFFICLLFDFVPVACVFKVNPKQVNSSDNVPDLCPNRRARRQIFWRFQHFPKAITR